MNNPFDFKKITDNFLFEGEFIEAAAFGCGHINDTFAASFRIGRDSNQRNSVRRYILQRINRNIFREPEKLMENIEGVTRHLRKKIIKEGGDPDRETLNLVPALDGRIFFRDGDDNYWRGYVFIENARTYQTVENPIHFYHAGKAFGKFQNQLSDYPAATLHETIPDFHHTQKRFEALVESIEKDRMNRAKSVKREIEFALKRGDEANKLTALRQKGELPLKVTHNDTKYNNVLINDATGQGICVIDLDTVMPGLSLYDFGDSIRSGANPAAEDEQDLSRVCMDLGLFEAFTRGFLESSAGSLTETELLYLPFSAKLMTYECGIRFLADYINGDQYFKISRGGHNVDRARTQFSMVEDMENKLEEMQAIINRYRP